ncbi:glutathione S-transferase family protein [Acinetobacter baumannii]
MIRDKNLLSYLFTILLTAVVTFFLTEFYYKRDEIKDLKSENKENENISIKLSHQENVTKSKNEDLRRKDEDIHAEFIRHLDRIEQVLLQTGWLVGDKQTIADIAVVAQLGEVIRTSKKFGAEVLARPAIASWYK